MDTTASKMHDVHVEISLSPRYTSDFKEVLVKVASLINTKYPILRSGNVDFSDSPILIEDVKSIVIADLDEQCGGIVPLGKATLQYHIYQLNDEPPAEEQYGNDDGNSACLQLVLPATCLEGLWESLVFDSQVKLSILHYASTAMLFSDKHVNWNIISWNRVILLHGPPGTGKTSLCKALAQKLSIRFSERYPIAQLVEINAHSLFSKWFSESGKLVMALFNHIHEMVDDPETLVCILIDEVESIAAARKAALSGSEPSDSIRVVNALLTQIDVLRSKDNVLLLTTSNITEAIDLAFVDRADMKQYIGLPGLAARYEILRSCLMELIRVGIIFPVESIQPFFPEFQKHAVHEKSLMDIAALAEGLSGRALRKLPFQAHAFFIQIAPSPLSMFLQGLRAAVIKEHEDRLQFVNC